MKLLKKYYHWLHGQWHAGKVEKLPIVGENGLTNIAGVRVVGDLSGIPLLKFSSETGSQAVHAILTESHFLKQRSSKEAGSYDVAIIGGGVSGFSAALEASKAGLRYVLIEASSDFSTLENFPKAKPIFTYPTEMTPTGGLQYHDTPDLRKESLLDGLKSQCQMAQIKSTKGHIEKISRVGNQFVLQDSRKPEHTWKALRVIVAIGRSGDFRKLNIEGEESGKVSNRLHDPKQFTAKKVLVVGGGDSAAEAAIALAHEGAEVSLSYRKPALTRPKPENLKRIEQLVDTGKLTLLLGSTPQIISKEHVELQQGNEHITIANDCVFTLIGRNPPLNFFRQSGLEISGDKNRRWWLTLLLSLAFFIWLYHWKKGFFEGPNPRPTINWLFTLIESVKRQADDSSSFLHTLQQAAGYRHFYYSLAYCLLVSFFGWRRVKRRKTPYVKAQTITLACIQWIPLFILPELLLPWLGSNGVFSPSETGAWFGQWIGEHFFPNGSYWRSYGLILAWPLFIYNWFTGDPLWGWLILGFLQTFVLIPWMIRKWGKGAYCGWICSCGALAETVGDAHRHKMPHGPGWNKLNMIGQIFLAFALFLLLLRIAGWISPNSFAEALFSYLETGAPINQHGGLFLLNYQYFVDLLFAGIIGVAFYFHYSGRVWCRFACPLAALMHIYARFSQFRIFADKNKCISCNVCTSVCHQGIDIMNFANKGNPMEDPECVRCSACVQQCPTGVLNFGRLDKNGIPLLDKLAASAVQIDENSTAKNE